MNYTKLFNVIDKEENLKTFITNMSSGNIEVPYIMSETFKTLDDDNPILNLISDTNKRSLCIMLEQYFSDCYMEYMEDRGLDKLLAYGKLEIYKIDAANGLRYATRNEVEQGVTGLIPEYVYPAGEDKYKLLCLLQWTFTGKSYHFRQAGYKLEYDKEGKVLNTFYEMINMCALQLKDLFDWLKDHDNYEKTIRIIEKMRKNKGYKYATYEKDEISEDITIKQLVYNIRKVFPHNSPNMEYRRALAMAVSNFKGNKKLSPLDISFMRETYTKFAMDKHGGKSAGNENESLKAECEKLLAERYSGCIDAEHFAYKIIGTLKKEGYTRCSPKQHDIIKSALELINKKKDIKPASDDTNTTQVISDAEIDSSLASLSDAIGQGLFDDDEEE